MEFETLRQKAEARVAMGSGFPGEFVSVLCMQNAALSKNGKTLALASLGNTLAFPQVSVQMRRLLGHCGYASRQDVLVAQDLDTVSEEEDFEPWMAYRQAARAKKEGGEQGNRDKPVGGGRAENPINRRTGQRNRWYARNSEYHYAP